MTECSKGRVKIYTCIQCRALVINDINHWILRQPDHVNRIVKFIDLVY